MKKVIKQIPLIFCFLSLISCKFDSEVSKKTIEGKEIPIDSTITGDPEIEEFIAPFKEHLNKTLARRFKQRRKRNEYRNW